MYRELHNIALKDLNEYDRNPRKHGREQVAMIAESLKEYGWMIPIVVDSNRVIIAGHGRVAAAKKLGWDTALAMIVDDLTEEQVKAYRVADNKLAESSEWDIDLLKGELEELDALGFNMDSLGFNTQELFSLTSQDAVEDQEDVQKLWEDSGMPDLKNETLDTYKIIIHFDSIENRRKLLNEVLGYKDVEDKQRSLWWPLESTPETDKTAHVRIMGGSEDGDDLA